MNTNDKYFFKSSHNVPARKTDVILYDVAAKICQFDVTSICTNTVRSVKGKRNAYFEFLNVWFILRTLFFLISEIYRQWYQKLNFSQISVIFVDDAFHLPWRHCHVQVCTDYTWMKPELENEWLSKVMSRWVSFRLNVVSLITNNDNSWPTFPNCNRFLWYE